MDAELIQSLRQALQQERRILLRGVQEKNESLDFNSADREPELEEEAQQDRDSTILEHLEEQEQARVAEIDAALERMDAGTYGTCSNCGKEISEARLRAIPSTPLCEQCSRQLQSPAPESEEETEIIPRSGRLPPDLDGLDDSELEARLQELVRENRQVDLDELQIQARQGVVYLEGSVPSEPEHQMLLNILTDIAGLQDIVDHVDIQRLAWEREDRSKNQAAQEVTPGTIPNQEPYAGTEDITLTNEEGVTYEPPDNPPPPPDRKD